MGPVKLKILSGPVQGKCCPGSRRSPGSSSAVFLFTAVTAFTRGFAACQALSHASSHLIPNSSSRQVVLLWLNLTPEGLF